jgi:hypothetical protein
VLISLSPTRKETSYSNRRFLCSYILFIMTTGGILVLYIYIYRVSQEECARLRESVPYVKIYRYNPKHLYPKLNCYGDNGHRNVWASGVSTYCTPSVTSYSSNARARNETWFCTLQSAAHGSSDVTAAACVKYLEV